MMQFLRTHKPLAVAATGMATLGSLELASLAVNHGDAHFEHEISFGPHSELAHTRIVYLCGVDADESKVSKHTKVTCDIADSTLADPFKFIYFHNKTHGLLLDWFEAIQLGILTKLHVPDPVTSSMINSAYEGVVSRLDLDTRNKELLVGHSEGAHFTLVLTRKLAKERPDLLDRVFVLYVEPMGADRPPVGVGFASVGVVEGHRLDFYLSQRTNLAEGIQDGFNKLNGI